MTSFGRDADDARADCDAGRVARLALVMMAGAAFCEVVPPHAVSVEDAIYGASRGASAARSAFRSHGVLMQKKIRCCDIVVGFRRHMGGAAHSDVGGFSRISRWLPLSFRCYAMKSLTGTPHVALDSPPRCAASADARIFATADGRLSRPWHFTTPRRRVGITSLIGGAEHKYFCKALMMPLFIGYHGKR